MSYESILYVTAILILLVLFYRGALSKTQSFKYLEPKRDLVPASSWDALYTHYKKLFPRPIQKSSLQKKLEGFVNVDEIDFFVKNDRFPYDNYVIEHGGGEKYQKRIPCRYYYHKYLLEKEKETCVSSEVPLPSYEAFTVREGMDTGSGGGASNYAGFLSSLFGSIMTLFVYVFVGCMVLYSVKVSQTDLMPTDPACEPYQYFSKMKIEEPVINADIVKMNWFGGDVNFWYGNIQNRDVLSTKIRFPVNMNMVILEDSLGFLRKWNYDEDCGYIQHYFLSIFESMTVNYAYCMNIVNQFLNQFLSESVIVFTGPYIFMFVSHILYMVNVVYGILLLFLNFEKLSDTKDIVQIQEIIDGDVIIKKIALWTKDKTKVVKRGNIFASLGLAAVGLPIYALFAFIFTFTWWLLIPLFILAVIILIVLAICAFMMLVFCISIVSFFISVKMMLLPLFFESRVYGTDEKYGVIKMFQRFMTYKKNMFIWIISYYIVTKAGIFLGSAGMIFAILACVFVYFFFPSIYQKYLPTSKTSTLTYGLTDYEAARKECEPINIPTLLNKKNQGTSYSTEIVHPELGQKWTDDSRSIGTSSAPPSAPDSNSPAPSYNDDEHKIKEEEERIRQLYHHN